MKIILVLLSFPMLSIGQPNCNVFKQSGDSLQYEACKLVVENENKYYQFSKEYQDLMHQAIEICPYFAYAYREISSPYVKSGDFLIWKKYIDKAVHYKPLTYLRVRASLRYKFFADFEGAIHDIDSLRQLTKYDLGTSSNGTYHLNIVKGLCLKGLGLNMEAIKVMKAQINNEKHYLGAFDYLHLGVLLLEVNNIDEAINYFNKQRDENNLAENHYYLAICYREKGLKGLAQTHLQIARDLYLTGYKMHDFYNELVDQVYLQEIEAEIIKNKG